MRFCVLGSGSKGNSIFVETGEAKILIDGGFSALEMGKRLENIGVSLEEIDALFISHEHIDHIKSVKVLYEKYGIKLFSNKATADEIRRILKTKMRFHVFLNNRPFVYKDMIVEPFSVFHDAVDPVGFSIKSGSFKFSVATDLGFASTALKSKMLSSDFVILESNHDEDMLMNSKRPLELKKRILGRHGHLSNSSAGGLLCDIYHRGLKNVVLAHLSEECNAPSLAVDTVKNMLLEKWEEHPSIDTALQNEIGKIYEF